MIRRHGARAAVVVVAGPIDIDYTTEGMKALPQDRQLANAPNYQRFAQAVVTGASTAADTVKKSRREEGLGFIKGIWQGISGAMGFSSMAPRCGRSSLCCFWGSGGVLF